MISDAETQFLESFLYDINVLGTFELSLRMQQLTDFLVANREAAIWFASPINIRRFQEAIVEHHNVHPKMLMLTRRYSNLHRLSVIMSNLMNTAIQRSLEKGPPDE